MKKTMCVIIALTMVFASLHCVFADEENIVLYGDANGDGKINARDVITIMRYIVDKSTPIDVQAANVRKSSLYDKHNPEINARDVITLMKYIVGADFILGKDVPTSIPSASDFSDERFEDRLNPIVRIKSATLYKNGTVTEFAPDDPKIIRLINFISYPERDMHLNSEVDGMFNDEDIKKIRSGDFRMEIDVDNPNEYGNHFYCVAPSVQFDLLVIESGFVVEYSYGEIDEDVWGPGYTHYSCGYGPYDELGNVNILEWCGF